jgi:FixJ family two-component response regulator
VDDDEPVRRALGRLLSTYSLPVRAYPSAREFLEFLKTGAPACLILDMQMPDMTGLELLHHLAGAGFTFPVIIMTANEELGLEHKCMLAGAFAFLRKPFCGASLVETLMGALAKPA